METDANPEYRLDLFKIEIENSIRLMGQTLFAMKHEFDTRGVIDHLASQIVLPMLLRTIFRIRLPKDFGLHTKQQNKKNFQTAIDKYFDFQYATENRYHTSHRLILTHCLETIGQKLNFVEFKDKILSCSKSLTPGSCEYHDELIHVVKLCLDHISDLYEANDIVVREEDNDNQKVNDDVDDVDDVDDANESEGKVKGEGQTDDNQNAIEIRTRSRRSHLQTRLPSS